MIKLFDLANASEWDVIVHSFENYDVQKLMIECDMMITDYSSVQFDFAYMKKPILLYQFDREAYQSGHQGKGYFDPDNDTINDENIKEVEIYDRYNNNFLILSGKSVNELAKMLATIAAD